MRIFIDIFTPVNVKRVHFDFYKWDWGEGLLKWDNYNFKPVLLENWTNETLSKLYKIFGPLKPLLTRFHCIIQSCCTVAYIKIGSPKCGLEFFWRNTHLNLTDKTQHILTTLSSKLATLSLWNLLLISGFVSMRILLYYTFLLIYIVI